MTADLLLPHVVVGGAPRAGTTFLCELLARHPGAYVARPFIPEPKVCMRPHPQGRDGYRAEYRRLFSQAPANAVRVEKTSYYFENADARQRLVELLPDAKFVFILREPVSRAYSNWLWSRKNGLETLSFAEAIALEGQRESPLPPDRAYARPFDYMSRGRYGTHAKAWIEAVGRERIAFYIFETAVGAPEPFVDALQDFMCLERRPWSELAVGRINATEPDPEGLSPALAERLRETIRPELLEFAALTGLDIESWVC